MQLKIRRSQRMGGVMGGTPVFQVDARVEFTAQEAADVEKYKLGRTILYDSKNAQKHKEALAANPGMAGMDITSAAHWAGAGMNLAKGAFSFAASKLSLTITVDSLQRGQRIELKDLEEVMGAEAAVKEACQWLRMYLDTAATFNGDDELVEYTSAGTFVKAPPAPALQSPAPHAIESSATPTETLALAAPSPRYEETPFQRAPSIEPETGLKPVDQFLTWFSGLSTAQKGGVIVGALVVLYVLLKIL
jgi:hypothetical protein